MADGLFYLDLKEPAIAADVAAVTLSTTDKALYPVANFPFLGGQYFVRVGKKMKIRLFGRITTGATPGNLTFDIYYGSGADANGTILASSAALTLIASQTNLSFEVEVTIHARSLGATGTLFCDGHAIFNPAVIAANTPLIPASAAAVSGSVDLTAANIISVQAKRSGSTAESITIHDMEVVVYN